MGKAVLFCTVPATNLLTKPLEHNLSETWKIFSCWVTSLCCPTKARLVLRENFYCSRLLQTFAQYLCNVFWLPLLKAATLCNSVPLFRLTPLLRLVSTQRQLKFASSHLNKMFCQHLKIFNQKLMAKKRKGEFKYVKAIR